MNLKFLVLIIRIISMVLPGKSISEFDKTYVIIWFCEELRKCFNLVVLTK
jgi:hypothetical protein